MSCPNRSARRHTVRHEVRYEVLQVILWAHVSRRLEVRIRCGICARYAVVCGCVYLCGV